MWAKPLPYAYLYLFAHITKEAFLELYKKKQAKANPLSIKPGDQIVLYPQRGNKKTLHLIHKKVPIRHAHQFSYDSTRGLSLPNAQEDDAYYLIYLHPGEEDTYRIKSLCGQPFKIDGVSSYESPLSHGDTVILGWNKLVFYQKEIFQSDRVVFEDIPIKNITQSSLNVLIQGETGTGKSYLARKIHEHSHKKGAFVHLNLASFSKNLIESEIFGHKKGSFTGALRDKKGCLLQAHKGTLFLDEIDSLSWDTQTKLLLFFDSKRLRPVGQDSEENVDTKIIIASGSPLLHLVKKGHFRRDLYYRISSGHKIVLRPLRENTQRITDILHEYEIKQAIRLSSALKDFYLQYSWPGNCRQLYAHLELKQHTFAGKYWTLDDCDRQLLEDSLQLDHSFTEDVIPLRQLKKDYVSNIFHQTNCSFEQTSKLLQIAPNTVRNILSAKEPGDICVASS